MFWNGVLDLREFFLGDRVVGEGSTVFFEVQVPRLAVHEGDIELDSYIDEVRFVGRPDRFPEVGREIVDRIDEELHGFAVQDDPLTLEREAFNVEKGGIRQVVVHPHSSLSPVVNDIGIRLQNGVVDVVEGTQGYTGITEQNEKRIFFRIAEGVLEES